MADIVDAFGTTNKQKRLSVFLRLFLVLVFVAVTIIGIVIVFNALNKGDEGGGNDEPYSHTELNAFIKGVDWEAGETGDVDEGAEIYKKTMEENSDDQEKLLGLRIAFAVFLTRYNYMEESLEQLNMINQTELSATQKIKLFMAYRDYYLVTDDLEKAELYTGKIDELMKENNYDDHKEF